jgi:DNA polymerase bacteriophage-type
LIKGEDLIQFFCTPNNPEAIELGGAPTFNEPSDHPEKWERFIVGNRLDVLRGADVDQLIPECSLFEQDVQLVDGVANDNGVPYDQVYLEKAFPMAQVFAEELESKLPELTGGVITKGTQTQRIRKWINDQGFPIKSIAKDKIGAFLARDDVPEVIGEVIDTAQEVRQAAYKKLIKMRTRSRANGKSRHTLVYYGAEQTGRWSSRGSEQTQNWRHATLLATAEDRQTAMAAIREGDIEALRAAYSKPLEAISDTVPMALCVPHVSVDLSSIEARVLSVFAHEEWKIKAFREYDADPKNHADMYVQTGARVLNKPIEAVTKEERDRCGKPCELAFGYACGADKAKASFFRKSPYSLEQVKEFRDNWQIENRMIVHYWGELDKMAIRAVRQPYVKHVHPVYDHLAFEVVRTRWGDVLELTLPSGRKLFYPKPGVARDPRYGGVKFHYTKWGNANPHWMHGGAWAAHTVQASSRDLLAATLIRVHAAGFKIILHCHDEVVCEFATLEEAAAAEATIKALVVESPDWAARLGIPIAAKSAVRMRYEK